MDTIRRKLQQRRCSKYKATQITAEWIQWQRSPAITAVEVSVVCCIFVFLNLSIQVIKGQQDIRVIVREAMSDAQASIVQATGVVATEKALLVLQ